MLLLTDSLVRLVGRDLNTVILTRLRLIIKQRAGQKQTRPFLSVFVSLTFALHMYPITTTTTSVANTSRRMTTNCGSNFKTEKKHDDG